MREPLWWAGFTVIAVWLEYFFPGICFLAPGLIVCLQEDKTKYAGWLLLVWILIQEGAGGLSFGFSILWFAGIVICYYVGRWLFQAKSILFMCLMGIAAGVLHYVLVLTMVLLQDKVMDMHRLYDQSLWQAGIFAVEWAVLSLVYPKGFRNAAAI